MTVRVKTLPGALEELMAQAAGPVTEVAAEVASGAAEIVPYRTGHASASYQSTRAEIDAGGLVATAYTDDVAGHLLEFGSVNNPIYRPLTRSVERLGLRHRDFPKGGGE